MPTPRIFPLLATAALAVLATAATPAVARPPGISPGNAPQDYSVLQLNLCLSGLAGCYPETGYPSVVNEAIATIQEQAPNAVTVNEACSGNAVLTAADITFSAEAAFTAQLGSEERRWLCVQTDDRVRACTAHLSVAGSPTQAATNDVQCAELTAVLGRAGQEQATVFGGDVNRQGSCAPAGAWTATDAAAAQAPGIQHAYGSRGWLLAPETETVPMTYPDHDGLLVEARLRTAGA